MINYGGMFKELIGILHLIFFGTASACAFAAGLWVLIKFVILLGTNI